MDSPLRQFVKDVINAPDEALSLSRLQCHARNIRSIVTNVDNNGYLRRYFIADKGHELDPEHQNSIFHRYTVGVHNHEYDLKLSYVHGDIENWRYAPYSNGDIVNCYRNGTPVGKVGLSKVGSLNITPMNNDYMLCSQFHTICVCSPIAIWKVEEKPPLVGKGDKYLFNNASPEAAPTILFKGRDHVLQYLSNLFT